MHLTFNESVRMFDWLHTHVLFTQNLHIAINLCKNTFFAYQNPTAQKNKQTKRYWFVCVAQMARERSTRPQNVLAIFNHFMLFFFCPPKCLSTAHRQRSIVNSIVKLVSFNLKCDFLLLFPFRHYFSHSQLCAIYQN